jgi:hypothetical protein
MIKKILAVGGMVMGLFAMIGSKMALAAADADLAAGFASTTEIFTDNKSAIITWLVGIFLVLIVITLIFGALKWTRRQAGGIFGGGRRRR